MTPDSWAQKLATVSSTLRSLKIKWDTYGTPTSIALSGLINMLKTLTYQPSCISELFLILFTTEFDSDELPGLDWEVLDETLSDRSIFPWLETLTIQLCPTVGGGYHSDRINFKPRLQARFEETKTKFSRLFVAANDYLDFKFEIDDEY